MLANEADFGGYTGVAASLVFIAGIILILSPPLAPKD
jgi:hypothetical protein